TETVQPTIPPPGTFHYARTFGPLKDDSILWIASCTKLLTSIAALQCVERGLLNLDDDVSDILHEFRELQLLDGHLLTHTSGLAYDHLAPSLARWQKSRGRRIGQGKTVQEKYAYPLLYEPGSAWSYGAGIDWAGLMVERVNACSLAEYMEAPQLDERCQRALMRVMRDPEVNDMMGGLPLGVEKNWGLAGLLLMEDVEGGRRKGAMSWGGLPNLVWWIDREAGLCGLYGTQILPVGDLRSVQMCQLFEREMYDRFNKSKPRL
ncbi:MAG: hypothetical protein Q9195_008111, partial [Heterodermia aff. obscurata]